MGNIIFDDLGIDYKSMMKNPEGFEKQVKDAAESLKDILKSDDSVTSYIKSLPKDEIDFKAFKDVLSEAYAVADSQYPINALAELAHLARKLASDLEYLAKSKATYELAAKQDVMDKRTAHSQYLRLREAFNDWVKAMKTLNLYSTEPLPGMPGNYGDTVGLARYVFFFQNEDGEFEDEGYVIPQSVCRRLGIELMNLMDTIEYINNHPECGVSVRKVTN